MNYFERRNKIQVKIIFCRHGICQQRFLQHHFFAISFFCRLNNLGFCRTMEPNSSFILQFTFRLFRVFSNLISCHTLVFVYFSCSGNHFLSIWLLLPLGVVDASDMIDLGCYTLNYHFVLNKYMDCFQTLRILLTDIF